MSHIIVIHKIKYSAFKHKHKLILNIDIFLIRQNVLNAENIKVKIRAIQSLVWLFYCIPFQIFFYFLYLPFTFLHKL